MNPINRLFKEKSKNVFSIYLTAGFPNLNDTLPIVKELVKEGVDMIEIGIPFSDPLADGQVIQESSSIAIRNGMNLHLLFTQLRESDFINKNPTTAFLLMGYFNTVLQYGVEKFCAEAAKVGIAGCIIPDLPLDEYLSQYKKIFDAYQLKNIFLITPQTSAERIRLIDRHSSGFIYMVSSSHTTGVIHDENQERESYYKRIKAMNLKNPLMIGFGISDKNSFSKACEYAEGAIVGSAFIKQLYTSNAKDALSAFRF